MSFDSKEQELKYNTVLFDLLTTLAARVTASLLLKHPRDYLANPTEVKVGHHVTKLMHSLRYMENYKRTPPMFSTTCDRLLEVVEQLLKGCKPKQSQSSHEYWQQMRNEQLSDKIFEPKQKIVRS